MVKIKYFLSQSWLLIVSSFFFGLLLAVTEAALRPAIEKNTQEKFSKSAELLLPQANKFVSDKKIIIIDAAGKPLETEIYKGLTNNKIVGYAFNCTGSGFAGKIVLVVAVDKNFEKISGFSVLESSETPGFGDKIKNPYYNDQFKGAPAEKLELVKVGDPKVIDNKIVAITGATISSTAVVDIMNNTILQIKQKMKGEK